MWKTFDVVERVDICFLRIRREEVERFNEEVRQNRAALRTLTEAVLYLSKQELSFRGHDESIVSLNKGNYRELLELVSKCNPEFECRLHRNVEDSHRENVGVGVFTGVSADIQNDIIECVNSVLKDEIDRKITECNFLSIQVDETTDVATKEQLKAFSYEMIFTLMSSRSF